MTETEQRAKIAAIEEELDLFGSTCLVKVNGKIDYGASVYEVLNRINAVFPDLELPFGYLFEKARAYVAEWREWDEKNFQ